MKYTVEDERMNEPYASENNTQQQEIIALRSTIDSLLKASETLRKILDGYKSENEKYISEISDLKAAIAEYEARSGGISKKTLDYYLSVIDKQKAEISDLRAAADEHGGNPQNTRSHYEAEIKKLEAQISDLMTAIDEYKKAPPDSGKTAQKHFDDMGDGREFEFFCADLLRKDDFVSVEVTSGSGDHGVDILAEKDGITYAIQCKHRSKSSKVDVTAIREIYSGRDFYKKHVGVVMTNRSFTDPAKKEAKQNRIALWDRERIKHMMRA